MANPNNGRQSWFFVLCGLLVVIACLYWAQRVLIPVALAIFLAFVLSPAVSALQHRGLGRMPSVILVAVLVFVLLGSMGWIISRQVAQLVTQLPNYQGLIARKIDALRGDTQAGWLGRVRRFLDEVTGPHDNEAPASDQEKRSESSSTAPATTLPGTTPEKPLYVTTTENSWSRVWALIGPAGEGLASAFLVVVLTIFMLAQRENLRDRLVRLIGHGRLALTTQALNESAHRISRFLLMQCVVNVTFGLLLALGLFLLGMYADQPGQPALRSTALLWGFLAAILRFVPYLGTWIAAALILLFSFAILPGWALPVVVLGYFLFLELVTANVVEPLLFGHSTGSAPLALLMSAAFWTWLWGPVGLVLSTPLTVIMVILGKYVPQLRFFEVLLGDEPALTPAVTFYQRLVARDQDEAADLADDYLEQHGFEALCADLLMPAVVQGRRDHDRGDLDGDSLRALYQGVRDVLDDVTPSSPAAEAVDQRPVLLACPARDEGDELLLQIVTAPLLQEGYRVEVLTASALASEMVQRIEALHPAVFCVGSAAPGGLAQTRYICKRVHLQHGGVKIVVVRWGESEELERVQKRLKASGADYVATTSADFRARVIPLLQVAGVASSAPRSNGRSSQAGAAGIAGKDTKPVGPPAA